ncbi:allatostatin C-like [Neocloeon triangulifer]|uniref:allatostatin C-like n=1 Tax=Neocloeon triangulifer TaxID=2078957 RepID=UPI00286EE77F|nr:allatostatin C-like [Neocloeon triangulifer]
MHSASFTFVALSLLCAVTMAWSMALSPEQKDRLSNTLELGDDDGSVETALMNYLFAKQIVSRLRNQLDVTDLQRKRSYWKQCAFNAVSCFG